MEIEWRGAQSRGKEAAVIGVNRDHNNAVLGGVYRRGKRAYKKPRRRRVGDNRPPLIK